MDYISIKNNWNLSKEELDLINKELSLKLQENYFKLKTIEKKIIGKLWMFFFLPFIGIIFYVVLVNRRKSSHLYLDNVIPIKKNIAWLEFQILHNNRIINEK